MPNIKSNNSIASGPQPKQDNFPESFRSFATIGAGMGAIAVSGFAKVGNQRMWDKYIHSIRTVETASPGSILRTFRTSEYLSPLESWSSVSVSKDTLKTTHKYSKYLENILGPEVQEGIKLDKIGSVFGLIKNKEGKVLGMGAQIMAGTQQGTAIADYFARITGTELGQFESLNLELLKSEYAAGKFDLPFNEWMKTLTYEQRQKRLILAAPIRSELEIAGKTFRLSEKTRFLVARSEIAANLVRAKSASSIGRLNVLLSKPLEVPIVGDALKHLPLVRDLAVKPGTSTQMIGRFTKKAIGLMAAWKGLEYYDYLRASGSPMAPLVGTAGGALAGGLLFKGARRFSPAGVAIGGIVGLATSILPKFKEGLFYGAASTAGEANIQRARVSNLLGFSESLKEQEEITPGLISPSTSAGFIGIGGMYGAYYQYGSLMRKAAAERYNAGGKFMDIVSRIRQERELSPGFWGTTIGKKVESLPGGKALSKVKSPIGLGAIAGLGAWLALSSGVSLLSGNPLAAIPGLNLLASKETPEELERIYSGEEEVPVRKGRWWEFGRSPFEGNQIDYYRQHFLPRLRSRAYQKGVYGSEEERWDYDPWLNPLKAIFGPDDWKYHYEMKYQYERPAPLTSTYGENIPFVGPLVAATVGKILKPRLLVRPEEWMGEEGFSYREDPYAAGLPVEEFGGLKPGAPVHPETGSQLINELIYRKRELTGLVGFAEGSLMKSITGQEEVFSNKETFATMGGETGSEYWLWDHLNLGGALGSSEPIRRFVPHERRYLEHYNPLVNDMPSWMPMDYYNDPRYGNPFDKIPEAEIRLPGPGFAALNPDVASLRPEEYPLAYRVKILGDVAMWSGEYRSALAQAKSQIKEMSPQEQAIVLNTEEQVRAKKKRKEFAEYAFNPNSLDKQSVTVKEVIDPRRIITEELGSTTVELQGFGAIKDSERAMNYARKSLEGKRIDLYTAGMQENAFDITARGPRLKAAAYVGGETYSSGLVAEGLAEAKQYGDEFRQLNYNYIQRMAGRLSELALHNAETPLEYLTPFAPASKFIHQRSALEDYTVSQAIGTQNAFWDRPMENFIDPAINLTKHKLGIGGVPEDIQNRRGIQEYFDMLTWTKAQKNYDREAASKTIFGVDAWGSPMKVMSALPRADRDYFQALSNVQTESDRQEIMSLLPSNQLRIYEAQWLRKGRDAAIARTQAGIGTPEDQQVIQEAKLARQTEGFSTNNTEQEWLNETRGRVPYDDWIRNRRAEEYFSTHSFPDASWIGWTPSVDLKDLEMKYVDMAGLDYHDFDLWQGRENLLPRKPYINETNVSYMNANTYDYNTNAIRGTFNNSSRVTYSRVSANIPNRYNIEVYDQRESLKNKAFDILVGR